MRHTLHLATILGVAAISNLHSEELAKHASPPVDPHIGIYRHVTTLVARDSERTAEIVSDEVAAHQSSSCEIVKAAIQQSRPGAKTVATIVEAAILAAPEHMRITAQCAIAVAPEATEEIQAVVARLDSASGGSAGQSAKSPMEDVAYMANPLDFPAQIPDGLTPGAPPPRGPALGGLTPFGLTPFGPASVGAGGGRANPAVLSGGD